MTGDETNGGNTRNRFAGFYVPRSTQVPDNFFDDVLPDLSGAETKVLLYVFRRTFGFKKDADNIALSQMADGITTKDGRVLDRGTGLSKGSVVKAVANLVARGMLVKHRRSSANRGFEATTYAPALSSSFAITQGPNTPMSKNETRVVQKTDKPLSEKKTNKKTEHSSTRTVTNGVDKSRSLLRRMPDLKQPDEQTALIAQEILNHYHDEHSRRHYRLVAAKVPYSVIHQAISEIKADGGADNPAKVFTKRMEQYAARHFQKELSH